MAVPAIPNESLPTLAGCGCGGWRNMSVKSSDKQRLLILAIGALGVVYGDIGTSPLYALRECFNPAHGVPPTATNVLGVLSLIFWSLVFIVCIKYLTFVLRADNKGEGGILALLALAFGDHPERRRTRALLVTFGVFGAALLYGDGMITPCVSILGAMEGLEIATPFFKPYVVPLTIVVLIALFAFQWRGTGGVGKVFGPVTLIWFLAIAVLGLRGILMKPVVLQALNPYHGMEFLFTHGYSAFVVLGAVFLVVTGAEALYADLGHFGARPIRTAWYAVVFPALVLNYLGQGGLVLSNPRAVENPFYLLAPGWAVYPMIFLATAASAIASQALISGAFSITMQAIQLGYLPRLEIRHTSSVERGQIYLPWINRMLLICCVLLVLGFQSSSRLSAAYGIAVTLTMLITSVLFFFAARRLWSWNAWLTGLLCAGFISLELVFFAGNAIKIAHGGWFPLLVAGLIFTVMTTWKRGRQLLRERLATATLPVETFLQSLKLEPPVRIKGTAVFMSGNRDGTPLALLHNLKHNQVLHSRVILLTIITADRPHVRRDERVQVEQLPEGCFRVIAQFGFMETPNVAQVFECCRERGLNIELEQCTYFLSRETIIPTPGPGMVLWRERLFALLSRNAQTATSFFGLPENRVVELGMQVRF